MRDGEAEIHSLWASGRCADGVACGLRLYGMEISGFLHVLVRDDQALAEDAFSETCAALVESFPAFRWGSSFRTWAYAIARRVFADLLRDPHARKRRPLPTEELERLASGVRTATATFMRTDTKEHVRRLRARLDPEEQAILTLRIDRELAWREIAQVLEDDPAIGEAELERAAAALRKRFERIVGKLRALADAEGLLRESQA
jgi:RNA polymerase sigma-70 factor (ECF subfamily)